MNKLPTFREKIALAEALLKKHLKKGSEDRQALFWSGGKDSTMVLFLLRKIYFGKPPLRVIFGDSGFEDRQIVDHVKRLARLWKIELMIDKMPQSWIDKIKKTKKKNKGKRFDYFVRRARERIIEKLKLKIVICGNHFDEGHSKEKKIIRKRKKTSWLFPIFHFTNEEIWRFTKINKIPSLPRYKDGVKHIGPTI